MQVCQVSASSSLRFLRRRILNIVFEKIPFMSPRQPIKLSYLDKSHMKYEGLLNKHLCKKIQIFQINKNIKMSSFKSSKNIQKKKGGPDRSVSDNQSSSVTLNRLAMKARKIL